MCARVLYAHVCIRVCARMCKSACACLKERVVCVCVFMDVVSTCACAVCDLYITDCYIRINSVFGFSSPLLILVAYQ